MRQGHNLENVHGFEADTCISEKMKAKVQGPIKTFLVPFSSALKLIIYNFNKISFQK